MRWSWLPAAALLTVIAPVGAVEAQDPSEEPPRPICLTISGAEVSMTPIVLTAAIRNGAITIESIDECAPQASPAPTATPAATSVPGTTGDWIVNPIEQDPLTDEPTTFAYLEAEAPSASADPVGLGILCAAGKTWLYVAWGEYLGPEPVASVQIRVGDNAAEEESWLRSNETTGTFYPQDAVPFIRSLFDETRFVARTTPYQGAPVTAVFDITGIENAVSNVRESCDW